MGLMWCLDGPETAYAKSSGSDMVLDGPEVSQAIWPQWIQCGI